MHHSLCNQHGVLSRLTVTVSSALSEISKEELENLFWHGHGLTRRERPSVGDNGLN
jgi:hypothetical protein